MGKSLHLSILFTMASLVSVLGAWHMERDGNKCRRKGDREEKGEESRGREREF